MPRQGRRTLNSASWKSLFEPRACILLAIMGTALFIRLGVSTVPRLKLDEGWSYYLCRNDAATVMANLVKDRHPPLYYLALRGLSYSGVRAEVTLRLLWAVAAWLAVLCIYLMGREMFGEAIGLWGAGFYAISFMAWEYDTWIRMYTLLSLFSALSTWLFLRAQRSGGKAWATGYALCLTTLLYSHYFGFFVFAAHVCSGLVARRHLRVLALCWFVALMAFVPWLPSMQAQYNWHTARPAASHTMPLRQFLEIACNLLPLVSGLDNLPRLLPMGHALDTALRLGSTLLLGGLFVVGVFRLRSRGDVVLLLALLAPYVLLLTLLLLVTPELSRPRYYVGIIPLVGMAWGAAVLHMRNARWAWGVLAAAVVVVNLVVFVSYMRTPYFRAGDWKGAAQWVSERRELGQMMLFYDNFAIHAFNYYYAGDLVFYDCADVTAPTLRYAAAYQQKGGLPQVRLWPEEIPNGVEARMQGVGKAFLILWNESDPRVRNWFAARFGVRDALTQASYSPGPPTEVLAVQRVR